MTEEKRNELLQQKEELIRDKINEFKIFCLKNEIPFFATVALEKDNETKYFNEALTPIALGINLSNDRITKYAASVNENLVLKFKQQRDPKFFATDEYDSILSQDY